MVCHTIVNQSIIGYDGLHHGNRRRAVKTARDWQAEAKGIIRGELKRRNLSYADLAARLTAIGVKENEKNVNNKIARGGFTAAFFLQCMEAIGVSALHFEHGAPDTAEPRANSDG